LEPIAVRELEHQRHLVRAVAVHVHEDVALEHADERLEPEVASRRLGPLLLVFFVVAGRIFAALLGRSPLARRVRTFGLPDGELALVGLPLASVLDRVLERLAVARDVAHPRRRSTFFAVDALGVLAAGHLESGGRTFEANIFGRARARTQLDREAA